MAGSSRLRWRRTFVRATALTGAAAGLIFVFSLWITGSVWNSLGDTCAASLVFWPAAAAITWAGFSRTLKAQLFVLWAIIATSFGLFMLVVLFVQMGLDAWRWFQLTPELVADKNRELMALQQKLAEFDRFVQGEIAQIEREEAAELERAQSEEERRQIRKDYSEIKEQRRRELVISRSELEKEVGLVREDVSAWALFKHFVTAGPSSEPQDAGIGPALLGSIYVGIITLCFAVPVGVGAAIYLEEYRRPGPIARALHAIIQININNLAGIPSVVYGILGAYVFVDMIFKPLLDGGVGAAAQAPWWAMPFEVLLQVLRQLMLGLCHLTGESHPAARNLLGGGLTLGLLTLPVVIVASQEAIRAVPTALRHAALALGATRWQMIRHHVLPNALPGILTGSILALSRALGEAAPLVLFGALLYVSDRPSLFSRFTVMPMQIFGWADRPADAWRYNAGLASLILVLVILLLNALAIYLRQRTQKGLKW